MDTSLAKNMAVPTGKVRALLQFNQITGALISVLQWVDPETLNNELFKYREAMFDFGVDVVQGTYDDYKIVDVNTLPIDIYEESMDEACFQKIVKEYPLIRQINVLSRAILSVSESLGISQEELGEMTDYMNEVKSNNEIRKEFYRQSPDYNFMSYADVEEINRLQLEGGIHEAYGARPTTATGIK